MNLKEIRKQLIERDGITCYLCGKKTTTSNRQVEHVVPHAKGGTDDISNLKIACKVCNRKKGKTNLDDFVHKEIARLERALITLKGLL